MNVRPAISRIGELAIATTTNFMNTHFSTSGNISISPRHRWVGALILGVLWVGSMADSLAASAELVDNRKIWDKGGHNAFTDLVRWHDRWWCTFREAEG